MTAPVVNTFAQAVYQGLAADRPGDEQRGYALLLLVGALGQTFDQLNTFVTDLATGALLDPTRTTSDRLGWLSQFAGVQLTPGLSDAQQRAQITSPPAFQRGTPAAMAAAAQATLTGTKYVGLIERASSAYTISVATRTSETPNPAATEAAIRAQKPAGLILTYTVTNAETWDEATSTWNAPAVTWDNATSGL